MTGTNAKITFDNCIIMGIQVVQPLWFSKLKRRRIYFRLSGPPTLISRTLTWNIKNYIKLIAGLKCYQEDSNNYFFYCYTNKTLDIVKIFVYETQHPIYIGSKYVLEVFTQFHHYDRLFEALEHQSLIGLFY